MARAVDALNVHIYAARHFMQTILTRPTLYNALSHAEHAHKHSLSQRCAPQLANLLASSRANSTGQWQWCTPLTGPVLPFLQLPVVQQQRLLKTLAERQQALTQVAEQLTRNGEQALAEILYGVLRDTDRSRLFSVGGEPVLIDWYGVVHEQQPAAVAYVAADHAAMAMAAGAAARAQVPQHKSQKPWLMLGAVLLGVVLLALGFSAWQL